MSEKKYPAHQIQRLEKNSWRPESTPPPPHLKSSMVGPLCQANEVENECHVMFSCDPFLWFENQLLLLFLRLWIVDTIM